MDDDSPLEESSSKTRLVISFSASILFLIISYFFFSYFITDEKNFFLESLFYILGSSSLCFLVDFLTYLFLLLVPDTLFFIPNGTSRFRFSVSFFVSTIFIRISSQVFSRKTNFTLSDITSITSYFEFMLDTILLSFSSFNLIMCLKDLLLDFISTKMYFNHYSDRIKKNEEHLKILNKINRKTGKKPTEDIKNWGKTVYDSIEKTKINNILEEKEIEAIYNLIEIPTRRKLKQEEVIRIYEKIEKEKKLLKTSLKTKASLFSKLRIIFNIFFIIFGVFVSAVIFGVRKHFTDFLVLFGGIMLSFNFIFSSVIHDGFRSIIIILIIQPFDIGDKLKVGDKEYEVVDVGLLYSSFLCESVLCCIKNTKMVEERIINYRMTRFYDKKVECKNIKNKDKFEKELENLVKNRSVYTGRMKVRWQEKEAAEVSVEFKMSEKLKEEEDKFMIRLYDIIKLSE